MILYIRHHLKKMFKNIKQIEEKYNYNLNKKIYEPYHQIILNLYNNNETNLDTNDKITNNFIILDTNEKILVNGN
jgi:hypothetical protein